MYITVNGAKLFFDTVGAHLAITAAGPKAKPTLLVLHGGPGFDHWGLRFFFDRFADIAQVVYLDHRGNGRSRGGNASDPTLWTLAQWGDDIRGFCDALGIDRPIVLGQSFGGMVAQSYAARHPGHAAGLIFSSTAATMRLEDVLDGFEVLGGAEARAVAARFWTHASEADIATYLRLCTPLYNTTPRDKLAAVGGIAQWDVFRHFSLPAGEIWQMDLRPGLAAVSAPTLVLTGDTDPVTPAARAQDIFAALKPGVGRYVEMAGTGHGTFRDAPDKCETLLRDFIAEAARP
jgi:proline iminopeptidase